MSVTPQAPAAQLFGYEVGDDISKNKSLLKQCTEALVVNGVAVTLPPGFMTPDVSAGKSGTPYAIERQWILNLQSACAVKSSLMLKSAVPADLINIVALASGLDANDITVTVENGSTSGKKVTVTDGVTPEVYDDLADVDAVIAAIHGVSALVDAVKVANGTLANIAATNLSGGVTVVPPTFAQGENDEQSVFIAKWSKAIFDSLRTAGYIA